MTEKRIKPIVVLSNCLEFMACRYNGELIPNSFVKKLQPFVIYKPVCPEVEIGMGIPRDPIKIVSENGTEKLLQPSTGNDYSNSMTDFAVKFNSTLVDVDGFILKSRSPSCGIKDVKLSDSIEKGPKIGNTTGFFAREVLLKHEGLAIEDEGRLTNYKIREHFLTKLFLLAHFRHLKKEKTIQKLIQFHTVNKYILMSYNQTRMRELGKIIGSYDKTNLENTYIEYERVLKTALKNIARKSSNINMFTHVFGYFSDYLTSKEKAFFLDNLKRYRNDKLPVSSIITLLKSWVIKYDQEYLMQQTFFYPYPEELMTVSDSGKGRD
ncbi:MAG: DUF1722 domain-containing protein [Candidatus Dadabacteria bacterium]|nr:DUF1722 domain-containing protein [Candidatus Dadabacteria bacterium]NIX15562.1 DUF1722 domain-containing protein [Candidatus Dadabacteria bacterium]NIY22302.1 DUF1722 domain-containing protein [Candidatus Dadabacteria bacterium]